MNKLEIEKNLQRKTPLKLPTLILRHRKENLKKCSLRGLESRSDCLFFTYPKDSLPDLSSYILLTLDAPPLDKTDTDFGFFFIDSTWRYAEKILADLPKPHHFKVRSIPSFYRTAYPRKQTACPEPIRGLATLEALYIAYLISGRDVTGLLDFYYWKESFLHMNQL